MRLLGVLGRGGGGGGATGADATDESAPLASAEGSEEAPSASPSPVPPDVAPPGGSMDRPPPPEASPPALPSGPPLRSSPTPLDFEPPPEPEAACAEGPGAACGEPQRSVPPGEQPRPPLAPPTETAADAGPAGAGGAGTIEESISASGESGRKSPEADTGATRGATDSALRRAGASGETGNSAARGPGHSPGTPRSREGGDDDEAWKAAYPPDVGFLDKGVVQGVDPAAIDGDGMTPANSLSSAASRVAGRVHVASHKALMCYCRVVRKCPKALALLYLVGIFALVGGMWREFKLETDFGAFIKADGEAMRNQDAYEAALQVRQDSGGGRRLTATGHGDALAAAATMARARRSRGATEVPFRLGSEDVWVDFGDQSQGGDAADGLGGGRHGRRLARREANGNRAPAGRLPRRLAGRPGRRLQGSPLYIKRTFTVVYTPKAVDIFSGRALAEIRDFEAKLRSLKEWGKFCGEWKLSDQRKKLCDPGESFAAFVWPSQAKNVTKAFQRFELNFDAKGQDLFPLSVVLPYLQDNQEVVDIVSSQRFFPKNFDLKKAAETALAGGDVEAPPALRTTYTFMMFVGYQDGSFQAAKKTSKIRGTEFDEAFDSVFFPMLAAAESKYINIYYSGLNSKSLDIWRVLMQDLRWASGSFLAVALYMWFHTRSVSISAASLIIIFMSVPLAYVLTPAAKTTIASFLSIFLVVGIGSDVVFVFVDFWNQSVHLWQLEDRLAFMLSHAGKACFATSLATAVSFFANLASVLQPLREFGLFMGLCVMWVLGLVMLFIPSILVTRENKRIRKRNKVAPRSFDVSEGQSGELCIMDEEQEKHSHSVPLLRLTQLVGRCPKCIVLFSTVLVIVFFVGVAMDATVDSGIPLILPDWHNQVAGEAAMSTFTSFSLAKDTLPSGGPTCNATDMRSIGASDTSCFLQWCNAEATAVTENDSDSCWMSDILTDDNGTGIWESRGALAEDCSSIRVVGRIQSPFLVDWAIQRENFTAVASREFNKSGECTTSTCLWKASQTVWLFEGIPEDGDQARDILVSGQLTHGTVSDDGLWLVLSPPRSSGATHAPFTAAGSLLGSGLGSGTIWERQVGGATVVDLAGWKSPRDRLVIENWETGELKTSWLSRAADVVVYPDAAPAEPLMCQVHAFCSAGTHRCAVSGWRPLAGYRPSPKPGTVTAPAPARLLQETGIGGFTLRVPMRKRFTVTVVFGIVASDSSKLVGPSDELWRYDEAFEPANPWAQRAILKMCEDLPEDLRVVTAKCWVTTMRDYLEKKEERFPSRTFEQDIARWTSEQALQSSGHLWVVGPAVKACRLFFTVDVAADSMAKTILDYKVKWDAFIAGHNARATINANSAWHSASVWVRAEAEIAIVESTGLTIVLSVGCGGLGMLIFTADPWLSFLVMCVVIGTVVGLAFFMVTVMGWGIGPIEVIALVVFVGYAVTFALHIAHDFATISDDDPLLLEIEAALRRSEEERRVRRLRRRQGLPEQQEEAHVAEGAREAPEAEPAETPSAGKPEAEPPLRLTAAELRIARARMAVLRVGSATVSSAVSTLCSSIFLLFCTVTVFGKLGAVVMAVTILSLYFALVPLPALLMLVGLSKSRPWHRPLTERLRRLLGLSKRRRAASKRQGSKEELKSTMVDPTDIRHAELPEAHEQD